MTSIKESLHLFWWQMFYQQRDIKEQLGSGIQIHVKWGEVQEETNEVVSISDQKNIADQKIVQAEPLQ